MPQIDQESMNLRKTPWPWYVSMGIVGAGILFFTWVNFSGLLASSKVETPDDKKIDLPTYELSAWHQLPTQNGGRYKLFETAAIEVMRQITGRSKLQGHDAVAVVLQWMLGTDPRLASPTRPWDEVAFILCEHQDLRKLIYSLQDDGKLDNRQLTDDKIHGKYISPKELRPFRDNFNKVREEQMARSRELFGVLENQISEVLHKLALYESICRTQDPEAHAKSVDPFAFVALDQVSGSPWFSLTEIQLVVQNPVKWRELMKERVKNAPHLYISPEHQEALAQFQKNVAAGNGAQDVEALETVLKERRGQTVQQFLEFRSKGKQEESKRVLAEALQTLPRSDIPGQPGEFGESIEKIVGLLGEEEKEKKNLTQEIADEIGSVLSRRDRKVLEELQERLPKKAGYHPEDPKYRMLHLSFLEIRFPDLYQVAVRWQSPPLDDCKLILASFARLGEAYRTGEAGKFEEASTAFFATVKEVSEKVGPYPGVDTISDRLGALFTGGSLHPPGEELLALEHSFNRIKPFMWAWIVMLLGLLFFCLSLGFDSRKLYLLGISFYAVSLCFQLFGFFTRIIISGRPPVSNMYETVIWVSFMSAIFALILEAIYRRKVIILAGSLVATIGLVLADQLPLALDPKISPIVPVLRSNFWLTIHVLTIVSSYAGGTLAWGLGNVLFALIVFGSKRQETIKMLSQFTYRALQIAVLLLAAGTFLGGWWAAYSWGRFWGWDPKETGALIALLCYVIPLHMRYIGWIKDFGLAVSAIICYAAILMSWYGINFIIPAGLHAYGFGAGGASWVYWACLINIEWVLVAAYLYRHKPFQAPASPAPPADAEKMQLTADAKSEFVKA